jgi:hypothetical protein
MNRQLANEAAEAVKERHAPNSRGRCQEWVRRRVQARYGSRYDAFWRGSAKLTAEAWVAAMRDHKLPRGVVVLETGDLAATQLGDLLYKTRGSGGAGHVGIRTWGNQVAENSSVHWSASGGLSAVGTRDLEEYGAFQVVVRLPEE